MAPKQACAKYQYVVTSAGPKILPVDEPSCKDEESPADYNAGGYLPVKLNDTFKHGRYTVIRKLGWGHFSTVWLVKDSHENRHSALKVVKSAGRYAETARDEIKLLSRVQSFSPTHTGRAHIVSFLDSFSHQGPESSHICIVFEPLGENLLALIERNKKKGVPRALVKVISKQILLGLEYLHDECDLVHTDIKPENILISIPDIEAHIYDELSTSPSPISRRVGVPLPNKTRSGVTIPVNQQRGASRRQVQIFSSQPLSSPGRSAFVRSNNSSVSKSISHGAGSGNNSGDNSASSSFVAQMQLSRLHPTGGSNGSLGAAASQLSTSAPKVPSGLSITAPRPDATQHKPGPEAPAKPSTSTAQPQSPSTSSTSSSIDSSLVSTAAGSSSMNSTPPTSLSYSIGSAVAGIMGLGKPPPPTVVERVQVDVVPVEEKEIDRSGIPMRNAHNNTDTDHLSTQGSWTDRFFHSGSSFKEKLSGSFSSSRNSPNSRKEPSTLKSSQTRSTSGMPMSGSWKDIGLAAPAPAVVVSATARVGGDSTKDNFDYFKFATSSSMEATPSGSSSNSTTTARASPAKASHKSDDVESSLHRPSLLTPRGKPSSGNNPSLLSQTAPRHASGSTVQSHESPPSPPHNISQLSAHMHSHPSPIPSSPNLTNGSNHTLSDVTPTVSPAAESNAQPSGKTSAPVKVQPSMASPIADTSKSLTSSLNIRTPPPPPPTQIPFELPSAINSLPPISIKIADLGNATPSTRHYTEEIQTRQYRAPEAILGRKDWDARADIWSVACVVFELLTAEYLFDPQGQGELFSKDDDHMAQIIELLGDFALDIKMGGRYGRDLFDHTGALRYIRSLKPWPLNRVMVEKYLYTKDSSDALCEFLGPMLSVDMQKRATAKDMKDHPWLEPSSSDEMVMEW